MSYKLPCAIEAALTTKEVMDRLNAWRDQLQELGFTPEEAQRRVVREEECRRCIRNGCDGCDNL